MLRHEAPATYETDASCLSITEVSKKIAAKSGAETTEVLLKLLYEEEKTSLLKIC